MGTEDMAYELPFDTEESFRIMMEEEDATAFAIDVDRITDITNELM